MLKADRSEETNNLRNAINALRDTVNFKQRKIQQIRLMMQRNSTTTILLSHGR